MKVTRNTKVTGEHIYSFPNIAANLNGEDNILIEATSFEQAKEIYKASSSLDNCSSPYWVHSVWGQFKFKK